MKMLSKLALVALIGGSFSGMQGMKRGKTISWQGTAIYALDSDIADLYTNVSTRQSSVNTDDETQIRRNMQEDLKWDRWVGGMSTIVGIGTCVGWTALRYYGWKYDNRIRLHDLQVASTSFGLIYWGINHLGITIDNNGNYVGGWSRMWNWTKSKFS